MEEYNILGREKNSISEKIKLLFLEKKKPDILIQRTEIELICLCRFRFVDVTDFHIFLNLVSLTRKRTIKIVTHLISMNKSSIP